METNYKKLKRKHVRGHKLTGVNIEFYQHEVLKSENLNLSLLVRDFLDDYLGKNFPAALEKFKSMENLETPKEEAEE